MASNTHRGAAAEGRAEPRVRAIFGGLPRDSRINHHHGARRQAIYLLLCLSASLSACQQGVLGLLGVAMGCAGTTHSAQRGRN